MRSALLWRRSATAVGIYSSAVLGFLATVVAAHAFSPRVFGLYALVLAATGFFQSLLDLTVEEALIKYGFRYQTREDWGRLRRLFTGALGIKLAGAALGGLALVALALGSHVIFHKGGLEAPLLLGAPLPLVQAWEGVAGVALILRGRYDLRALFLLVSMALRLLAIVIGSRFGLTQTIAAVVLAQVLATAAVSSAGWIAIHRFPRAPSRPLGEDRRSVFSFVAQSTVASTITSLTTPLATLLLGRVSTTVEVGRFRVAQSPQQGFASLSAPARIILLTEQTRDWERGTRKLVFAGIRRYTLGAAALMIVVVPPLLWFMPDVVKVVFGAKNAGASDAVRLVLVAGAVQFVVGWTKSFPVSIGRPNLRIWTHALEVVVLAPLAVVLGSSYGATGAAGAVLASKCAFAAYWGFLYARIRREDEQRTEPVTAELETALDAREALIP